MSDEIVLAHLYLNVVTVIFFVSNRTYKHEKELLYSIFLIQSAGAAHICESEAPILDLLRGCAGKLPNQVDGSPTGEESLGGSYRVAGLTR